MLDQVLSVAMFMPLAGYVAFIGWTYFITESSAQKYLLGREEHERENLRDWTITIANQGKVEELVPARTERILGPSTEYIPVEMEV